MELILCDFPAELGLKTYRAALAAIFLTMARTSLRSLSLRLVGVAADLAEEANFVVGELREAFIAVGVSGLGEELRERKFHCAGNFCKRVERRNGVSVFNP